MSVTFKLVCYEESLLSWTKQHISVDSTVCWKPITNSFHLTPICLSIHLNGFLQEKMLRTTMRFLLLVYFTFHSQNIINHCATNQSHNLPHLGRIASCSAPNSRPPATKALHTICGNNTSIVSSSWRWVYKCPKHVEQIISAKKIIQ